VTETTSILPVLAPFLKDLKPHMVVKNPMMIRSVTLLRVLHHKISHIATPPYQKKTPKVMRFNAWDDLTRIFKLNSFFSSIGPQDVLRASIPNQLGRLNYFLLLLRPASLLRERLSWPDAVFVTAPSLFVKITAIEPPSYKYSLCKSHPEHYKPREDLLIPVSPLRPRLVCNGRR
jgi:hypothetical protein